MQKRISTFLSNSRLCNDGWMKNQIVIAPDSTAETEALLQGLIAECHQIIREVVVPSANAAAEDHERRRYLQTAAELVRVGAAVGDTLARLRGGVTQETRQRIVVERVEKTAAALLDIPKAVKAGAPRACQPADKPGEGVP